MKVIKLGGSLSYGNDLPQCLQTIANLPETVVIVPGGGAFADQVRMAQHNWQFDDATAHAMAILAMQQMALLLQSLAKSLPIADSVAAIRQQANPHMIWSPKLPELDAAGIEASWEVTSDSLAAWLAGELAADELVLVKSATIDSKQSIAELAELGIIDGAFCRLVEHARYPIKILNADDFNGAL